MRVVIDEERCSGHGRCYVLAPAVFDDDDDGKPVVLVTADLDDEPLAAARIAVNNCPESAISLAD